MKHDPRLYDERKQYDILFGEQLDEVRKQREISIPELAERSGVSESAVRGYISGRNEPTSYVIFRLAKTLRCSSDLLLSVIDI